jgi:hypothetical protein
MTPEERARREEAHAAWCDLDTEHTWEDCPEVGYDEDGVFFKPRPKPSTPT